MNAAAQFRTSESVPTDPPTRRTFVRRYASGRQGSPHIRVWITLVVLRWWQDERLVMEMEVMDDNRELIVAPEKEKPQELSHRMRESMVHNFSGP